jgi:hypothetical protein
MDVNVVALGYTCFCGERVKVFHLKRGETKLPHIVSVSCPNGHTATFTQHQVGMLESWTDEPHQLSASNPTTKGEGKKAA